MKLKCQYCGKMFDKRGLGPHESRCPSKVKHEPTAELDSVVDRFWNLLSREDKIRMLKRHLDN